MQNAKRDLFAHSYLLQSKTHIGFINRSRGGDYKATLTEFAGEEFANHVVDFVTAAHAFLDALETPDDRFEAFARAPVSANKG
jgi:hypothetical protein